MYHPVSSTACDRSETCSASGWVVLTVFSLLLIGGCQSSSSPPTSEAVRKIEQVSAARADAFNNGNAEAIATHFTEDAILMPPGQPADTGRAAVEAYYQSIFDVYETELSSRYVDVEVSGDLAYGRGIATATLTPKDGGESVTSTSKYLNILERQSDGTWKTTHDIWNANAPASGE
jgi:uncharacterized protein (TIGR02246 family)